VHKAEGRARRKGEHSPHPASNTRRRDLINEGFAVRTNTRENATLGEHAQSLARAVLVGDRMTSQHSDNRLVYGGHVRVACLLALAVWLFGHEAYAQEHTWADAFSTMGPYWRYSNPQAPADDPDLVRSGEFSGWRATIAEGATMEFHGVLDLDGDGVAERLLTVTPCADPYPYNRMPGLVLVRHTSGGFRALVLLRENDAEFRGRLERRRGRAVLTIAWHWSEGHASDGVTEQSAVYYFRLGLDGVLRQLASHASEPHLETLLHSAPSSHGSPSTVALQTTARRTHQRSACDHARADHGTARRASVLGI
jgi:hypothetical protein